MNVCIIPAKGSSTRIPGKNIKRFYGRPILAYSIECARASGLFKAIYVSTDSVEVYDIAENCGALGLIRPAGYVGDEVGPIDVVRVTLQSMPSVEFACCLTATSPLLDPRDLIDGFNFLNSRRASYTFAVGRDPLHDAGAFYWGSRGTFLAGVEIFGPDSLMIPLPPERDCDINTPQDWEVCERKYGALHK